MKFSSVVSIQICSLKNANPSINKIHVENDYLLLPSKFEMEILAVSGRRSVSTEVDMRRMILLTATIPEVPRLLPIVLFLQQCSIEYGGFFYTQRVFLM